MFSLFSNFSDLIIIATILVSTTYYKLPKEVRQKLGITDGLVRISVGLENIKDIIADIEQALNKINLL